MIILVTRFQKPVLMKVSPYGPISKRFYPGSLPLNSGGNKEKAAKQKPDSTIVTKRGRRIRNSFLETGNRTLKKV
jgi:hypothetical protein